MDDVIWSGSIVFKESVIDVIKTKFQISNEENQFFTYLGMELSQVNSDIQLKQMKFIDQIESIPISASRAKQKSDRLNTSEASNLRSLIGQILYATTISRPDASFDALELSMSKNSAKFIPVVLSIL